MVIDNTTAINTKREFHNDESSTYWLPKDDDEQMRLTEQHYAFKSLYGGNPCILKKGITVLDAGCGSGVWIMDMVQDYPSCTYHGCDIVDAIHKNVNVNQFTFILGNVVKGLPYEDDTFDFVHMRFFILALREEEEWPAAISEIIRVTKPGGMIQMSEIGFELPKDSSNLFYKVGVTIRDTCAARGQNAYIGAELNNMLAKHNNIEIVQSADRICDMSSGTSAAKTLTWDALESVKSMKPVMGPLMRINTTEELDQFLKELKHCIETKESLFRFNSVAAQKL
ncbi:S-adenosyl-L-methionine-dependent methyltransferase [Rhizopus microsporus var. microsporus]|uniref:S-adenosyl-L-methionine-dependent methyltransferase n=1 Tax=Rhizopus microsporus var. microsporus TaxID=86635 RepID=A0A1X0R4S7_RHIZD|nr:S-adenosyl-L-methionine-dependent methyltransferase [Rhizopus microsporus var. microsporus]